MSPTGPVTSAPSAASKRLLPWLVAVAFFMESLDTTILNTAVPAISAALHVGPLSMKAVLASYTLSLAVFIPISGWVADRFGTRRVFATAIGLFTLGSFLCGISSNIQILVACRILQGCGGSMMVPVGRLTLVRAFAKSELLRTMSFVSIPALIAPMLGPIAGGLIVGYLHWRVIFFLNIPDRSDRAGAGLSAPARLPGRDTSARYRGADPVRFRHRPAVLCAGSLRRTYPEHARISGLLGFLSPCWLVIGCTPKLSPSPCSNLSLFRIRTFRAAVSGSFFTRLGIGGVPFLLPLAVSGGSGIHSGAVGASHHAAGSCGYGVKPVMPRILSAIGYRWVLISNTIILGLLLLLFATIGLHTPVWMIVLQAFFMGHSRRCSTRA